MEGYNHNIGLCTRLKAGMLIGAVLFGISGAVHTIRELTQAITGL